MGSKTPPEAPLLPQGLQERTGTHRLARGLARFSSSRQGFLATILVLLGIVTLVGLWTTRAIDASLHESQRSQLTTILEADAKALEIWVRGELQEARYRGEQVEMIRPVEGLDELVREAKDARAALAASPLASKLSAHLLRVQKMSNYEWVGVIDGDGTILASTRSEEAGSRLSAYERMLVEGALEGRTYIERPRMTERTDGEGGVVDPSARVAVLDRLLFALTPIREPDGEVVGAMVLGFDPVEFTEILSVAEFGESGATYAVDGEGYMVSRSRHEAALRAIGMIPDEAPSDVFFSLPVRDPGRDVFEHGVPDGPALALPLTRAAAGLVAGESGMDLEGYRDYRGVDVIGAWKWLEDLDVGLVTEVDASEAFALLRPLRTANGVLVGVLGLLAVAVFLSTSSLRYLARRVRQLGQYRLTGKIGEGGVGSVYLAEHALLQRPTAIKMLRPDAVSGENLKRFEREVQLMSRLRHPNTVQVYDYGRTPEGVFYYVMEYLDGLTLADVLELTGPLSPARAIFVVRGIALALEEAHGIGLVHRDLKPLNVMLCRSGIRVDAVKVLDFGLVKEVNTPDELQLTSPGIVGGTPPYIAPERLQDPRRADPRSDLYSLGGVAYNLVSGQAVFEGSTAMETCIKVLEEDPPPLAKAAQGVPSGLADLVMQCLARDPEDRPRDAREIVDRLDELAVHCPWSTADARDWWESHAALVQQRSTPRPI